MDDNNDWSTMPPVNTGFLLITRPIISLTSNYLKSIFERINEKVHRKLYVAYVGEWDDSNCNFSHQKSVKSDTKSLNSDKKSVNSDTKSLNGDTKSVNSDTKSLNSTSVKFDEKSPNTCQSWRFLFDLQARIYGQAQTACPDLDVRFLLDNLKKISTANNYFQQKTFQKNQINQYFIDICDQYSSDRLNRLNILEKKTSKVVPLWSSPTDLLLLGKEGGNEALNTDNNTPFNNGQFVHIFEQNPNTDDSPVLFDLENNETKTSAKLYNGCVLGGTFDRLHNGHKCLLSTAALLSRQNLTCGVTDGDMLKNKTLNELIEPIQLRISHVTDFLADISPSLRLKVLPIYDPYGPSIVDTDIQCIVTSSETFQGGQSVNKKRLENNLPKLDIFSINLLNSFALKKIASSDSRKQLLGSLLKAPRLNETKTPGQPYIIGLTGGMACGKTNICMYLREFGAKTIDCDLLGHEAYKPGTDAYKRIVETFGDEVIDKSNANAINRKVLASKVFSDKAELSKLNSIVWPQIGLLAEEKIRNLSSSEKIIVLEAAVLLEAGWQSMVDEVWIAIVPKNEAVKRIMRRNVLTEQQASARLDCQMSNKDRVNQANVVFCSLWEYEATKAQVRKAWDELLARLQ